MTIARPRLLSDLSAAGRIAIAAAIILGGVILVHIGRYDWAAVYFNALESNATVTAHYHSLIPDAVYRHAGRFAIEGLYAGAAVQIVLYNWARHWPPKAPGKLHRYVFRPLLIPSARLPEQTLWCLAVSWLWMIVFAIPPFLAGLWLLTVTHTLPTTVSTWNLPAWLASESSLLTAWQFPVLGLVCSVAARPVIKGTAFHGQRLIIRERLDNGRRDPAWWMHVFPFFKWRFEYEAQRHSFATPAFSKGRALHVTLIALLVIAWLALTYQGWHILTYQGFSYSHPFVFHS